MNTAQSGKLRRSFWSERSERICLGQLKSKASSSDDKLAKMADPRMFDAILALILVGVGFVAGYAVRALVSRKRRAVARGKRSRTLDQKRYDDGFEPNSPSLVFSIPDEALEATGNADQLAMFSLGNCTDAHFCQVPNSEPVGSAPKKPTSRLSKRKRR